MTDVRTVPDPVHNPIKQYHGGLGWRSSSAIVLSAWRAFCSVIEGPWAQACSNASGPSPAESVRRGQRSPRDSTRSGGYGAGGAASGVELAGISKSWLRARTLARCWNRIDPSLIRSRRQAAAARRTRAGRLRRQPAAKAAAVAPSATNHRARTLSTSTMRSCAASADQVVGRPVVHRASQDRAPVARAARSVSSVVRATR